MTLNKNELIDLAGQRMAGILGQLPGGTQFLSANGKRYQLEIKEDSKKIQEIAEKKLGQLGLLRER